MSFQDLANKRRRDLGLAEKHDYDPPVKEEDEPLIDDGVSEQTLRRSLNNSDSNWAADLARDVGRAGISLYGTAVGVGDILTGGEATPLAKRLGLDPNYYRNRLNANDSFARQKSRAEVENAKGFVDTVGALASNPLEAFGEGLEALPYFLGASGAARAAVGLTTKAAAKAAVKKAAESRAAMEAAQKARLFEKGTEVAGRKGLTGDAAAAFAEKYADRYTKNYLTRHPTAPGLDAGTLGAAIERNTALAAAGAEGAMTSGSVASAITSDRTAQGIDTGYGDVMYAIPAGAVTAGISRVAGRFGGNVEAALGRRWGQSALNKNPELNKMLNKGIDVTDKSLSATGRFAGSKAMAKNFAKGFLGEGVAEEMPQSMQEQMWQNLGTGADLMEGVAESAGQGMVIGGLMGGLAGMASRTRARDNRSMIPGANPSADVVAAARKGAQAADQEIANEQAQQQAIQEQAAAARQPVDFNSWDSVANSGGQGVPEVQPQVGRTSNPAPRMTPDQERFDGANVSTLVNSSGYRPDSGFAADLDTPRKDLGGLSINQYVASSYTPDEKAAFQFMMAASALSGVYPQANGKALVNGIFKLMQSKRSDTSPMSLADIRNMLKSFTHISDGIVKGGEVEADAAFAEALNFVENRMQQNGGDFAEAVNTLTTRALRERGTREAQADQEADLQDARNMEAYNRQVQENKEAEQRVKEEKERKVHEARAFREQQNAKNNETKENVARTKAEASNKKARQGRLAKLHSDITTKENRLTNQMVKFARDLLDSGKSADEISKRLKDVFGDQVASLARDAASYYKMARLKAPDYADEKGNTAGFINRILTKAQTDKESAEAKKEQRIPTRARKAAKKPASGEVGLENILEKKKAEETKEPPVEKPTEPTEAIPTKPASSSILAKLAKSAKKAAEDSTTGKASKGGGNEVAISPEATATNTTVSQSDYDKAFAAKDSDFIERRAKAFEVNDASTKRLHAADKLTIRQISERISHFDGNDQVTLDELDTSGAALTQTQIDDDVMNLLNGTSSDSWIDMYCRVKHLENKYSDSNVPKSLKYLERCLEKMCKTAHDIQEKANIQNYRPERRVLPNPINAEILSYRPKLVGWGLEALRDEGPINISERTSDAFADTDVYDLSGSAVIKKLTKKVDGNTVYPTAEAVENEIVKRVMKAPLITKATERMPQAKARLEKVIRLAINTRMAIKDGQLGLYVTDADAAEAKGNLAYYFRPTNGKQRGFKRAQFEGNTRDADRDLLGFDNIFWEGLEHMLNAQRGGRQAQYDALAAETADDYSAQVNELTDNRPYEKVVAAADSVLSVKQSITGSMAGGMITIRKDLHDIATTKSGKERKGLTVAASMRFVNDTLREQMSALEGKTIDEDLGPKENETLSTFDKALLPIGSRGYSNAISRAQAFLRGFMPNDVGKETKNNYAERLKAVKEKAVKLEADIKAQSEVVRKGNDTAAKEQLASAKRLYASYLGMIDVLSPIGEGNDTIVTSDVKVKQRFAVWKNIASNIGKAIAEEQSFTPSEQLEILEALQSQVFTELVPAYLIDPSRMSDNSNSKQSKLAIETSFKAIKNLKSSFTRASNEALNRNQRPPFSWKELANAYSSGKANVAANGTKTAYASQIKEEAARYLKEKMGYKLGLPEFSNLKEFGKAYKESTFVARVAALFDTIDTLRLGYNPVNKQYVVGTAKELQDANANSLIGFDGHDFLLHNYLRGLGLFSKEDLDKVQAIERHLVEAKDTSEYDSTKEDAYTRLAKAQLKATRDLNDRLKAKATDTSTSTSKYDPYLDYDLHKDAIDGHLETINSIVREAFPGTSERVIANLESVIAPAIATRKTLGCYEFLNAACDLYSNDETVGKIAKQASKNLENTLGAARDMVEDNEKAINEAFKKAGKDPEANTEVVNRIKESIANAAATEINMAQAQLDAQLEEKSDASFTEQLKLMSDYFNEVAAKQKNAATLLAYNTKQRDALAMLLAQTNPARILGKGVDAKLDTKALSAQNSWLVRASKAVYSMATVTKPASLSTYIGEKQYTAKLALNILKQLRSNIDVAEHSVTEARLGSQTGNRDLIETRGVNQTLIDVMHMKEIRDLNPREKSLFKTYLATILANECNAGMVSSDILASAGLGSKLSIDAAVSALRKLAAYGKHDLTNREFYANLLSDTGFFDVVIPVNSSEPIRITERTDLSADDLKKVARKVAERNSSLDVYTPDVINSLVQNISTWMDAPAKEARAIEQEAFRSTLSFSRAKLTPPVPVPRPPKSGLDLSRGNVNLSEERYTDRARADEYYYTQLADTWTFDEATKGTRTGPALAMQKALLVHQANLRARLKALGMPEMRVREILRNIRYGYITPGDSRHGINGFTYKNSTGQILVFVDPYTGYSPSALGMILGHETFHALILQNPELFQRLLGNTNIRDFFKVEYDSNNLFKKLSVAQPDGSYRDITSLIVNPGLLRTMIGDYPLNAGYVEAANPRKQNEEIFAQICGAVLQNDQCANEMMRICPEAATIVNELIAGKEGITHGQNSRPETKQENRPNRPEGPSGEVREAPVANERRGVREVLRGRSGVQLGGSEATSEGRTGASEQYVPSRLGEPSNDRRSNNVIALGAGSSSSQNTQNGSGETPQASSSESGRAQVANQPSDTGAGRKAVPEQKGSRAVRSSNRRLSKGSWNRALRQVPRVASDIYSAILNAFNKVSGPLERALGTDEASLRKAAEDARLLRRLRGNAGQTKVTNGRGVKRKTVDVTDLSTGKTQRVRKDAFEAESDLIRLADVNVRTEGAEVIYYNPRYSRGAGGVLQLSPEIEQVLNKTPEPIKRVAITGFDMTKGIVESGFRSFLNSVSFTGDIISRIADKVPSAKAYWATLMARDSVIQMYQTLDEDIKYKFNHLSNADQKAANASLTDQNLSRTWAYRPDGMSDEDWEANIAKTDYERVRDDFNALSDDAQDMVTMVFDAVRTRQQEMLDTMNKDFEPMMDSLEKQASSPEEAKEVEKARQVIIGKLNSVRAYMNVPYLPLGREGNTVIVAKSKDYLEAEEAKANDLIEKYEKDPNHYQVIFTNAIEKEGILRKLKQDYPNLRTHVTERMNIEEGDANSLPTIQRIMNDITERVNADDISAKNARSMAAVLSDIYVLALEQDNLLNHMKQRKGISGYEKNMVSSYVSYSERSANYLANLKYGNEIRSRMHDMFDEAKAAGRDAEDLTSAVNTLIKSERTFRNPYSGAYSFVKKLTSGWMLFTAPQYYLQNATQPFMMSVPYMAKHGLGMGESMASMMKNFKEACKLMLLHSKDIKTLSHIDIDKLPYSQGVKEALKYCRSQNLLDVGMMTGEIGSIESAGTKYGVENITNFIFRLGRGSEVVNRLATAKTVYEMTLKQNLAKGMSRDAAHNDAMKFTAEVLQETHGNNASANTPLLIKGGLKSVIGQFRRFQILQCSLILGLAKGALKGKTHEERMAMAKALLWTMGTHLVMTGVRGTPLVAFLLMGAGALGGDDKDGEDVVRELIGNKDVSNLLIRGVPAYLGVDVSDRVGMSNSFSLFPFVNDNPTKGKAEFNAAVISAMGPFASQLQRIATGAGMVMDGDISKGTEKLLPKGLLSNLIAAERLAREGLTQKNGIATISPDEFSYMDITFKALGLDTSKLSDKYLMQGRLIRANDVYGRKEGRIRKDFQKAMDSHDMKEVNALRRDWLELQKERARSGLRPKTFKDLMSNYKQRKKQEKGAISGVTTNSSNIDYVQKWSQL